MRGLIGYIWSICSNGSLIKEKFSVVWWSISMEFVEFIQGSLISKFFSCTYLAESLTVRFELFYCTHNLNTPVGRCDVPIERQPLIRGASWKVLHDRSSSNVNVWWTGKTENRISSAEGEVRSSGERESRFIHEFSVRWRRKITPNSWLRVSLTKGVRKEKKNTHFDFPPHFPSNVRILPFSSSFSSFSREISIRDSVSKKFISTHASAIEVKSRYFLFLSSFPLYLFIVLRNRNRSRQ